MEIYKTYRPQTLAGVVGQASAVETIEKLLKRSCPHAILFSGPSGTGKTTLARIVAQEIDAAPEDTVEMNLSDFRGIDTIRDIRRQAFMRPIAGAAKVWILDEVQKITGDAQSSILKLLEDPPSHVYFMLCTTDPQKLSKPILGRCTEIKLKAIGEKDLEQIIRSVCSKEKIKLDDDVITEIIECAEGSARKALVLLEQVADVSGKDAQMAAVQATGSSKEIAIMLARELVNPRAQWGAVAKILNGLEDDPEGVRYLVLSYCRKVMLGGSNLAPRAFNIIQEFSGNFYDSKNAGLAAACWRVIHQR